MLHYAAADHADASEQARTTNNRCGNGCQVVGLMGADRSCPESHQIHRAGHSGEKPAQCVNLDQVRVDVYSGPRDAAAFEPMANVYRPNRVRLRTTAAIRNPVGDDNRRSDANPLTGDVERKNSRSPIWV